jgi:hypothetical protein
MEKEQKNEIGRQDMDELRNHIPSTANASFSIRRFVLLISPELQQPIDILEQNRPTIQI